MKRIDKYRFLSGIFFFTLTIFMLLSILVYKLAVSDTLETYKKVRELEDKISALSNVSSEINALKHEVDRVEKILGNSSGDAPFKLLEKLTAHGKQNRISLRSFPAYKEINKDGIVFQYQNFTIEGDFKSMVKLTNEIELNRELGKVISARYSVEEDLRTKKKALIADITVQNIILL